MVIPTTQLDAFVLPTFTPTSIPTSTPTPGATATATPMPTPTLMPSRTVTPIPSPLPTDVPTPTVTSTATPTLTPTPRPVVGYIGNTGGKGVFIHASPDGPSFTAWHDGTRAVIIGQETTLNSRNWLRLRDDRGIEGWVGSEYFILAP